MTSPLLAAAALAAKLEDGGPVLYRQTRVGEGGADFELLKLRTMVVGAERQGAGFAIDRGDPRITRVGRLLRKTLARRAAAALERAPRRHVDRSGRGRRSATRSSATRRASGGGWM